VSQLLKGLVELEKSRLQGKAGSLSDLIYRWNLRDFVEHAGGDCPTELCIGVSELVYCSNKFHLRRRYPELVLGENYASWNSFGRLIHLGLETLLGNAGFEVEREISRIINFDGIMVSVKGRMDAVGYWNDKLTVVEIKSSRSDNDLPKEQHVLQIRIYMNMARAEQGILLYVTPDRLTEYTIEKPLSDAELEILVKETLDNTRHPRYTWECQYCPFSMMCPYKQTNNNHKPFYKR
jgi:CRISPR-associated exonuclease Cas4